jgi:hypothetical protein
MTLLTILSRDGSRRAILLEDDDGPVLRHYRALRRGGEVAWIFDREARPSLPYHAARDLAVAVVNANGERR